MSPDKITPDDPRLTAFALEELEAAEAAEFAAALAQDQDAQTEVDGIRSIAALLEAELSAPALGGLSEDQRAQLYEVSETESARVGPSWRWMWGGMALAAGVAAAVALPMMYQAAQPSYHHESFEAATVLQAEAEFEEADWATVQPQAASESRSEPAAARVAAMSPKKPADDGDRGIKPWLPVSRVAGLQFLSVRSRPLSTFSIDVDTGSYSRTRAALRNHQCPAPHEVRTEEMLNYFAYDYPEPKGAHPFSVNTEVIEAPWQRTHRLVRIGLKGKSMSADVRPGANIVFLLDVSGSMAQANKLPLLTRSLELMVNRMRDDDRIAIVVYAGASGLVLPSTSGKHRDRIRASLRNLSAGGSTNGGAGIELAYQVAMANKVPGGINRVILATDGDFNVGTTGQQALEQLIRTKARGGVFLTTLGFGFGSSRDDVLELLADKGNGHYAFIDSDVEARKTLVQQLEGTLVTIAKDVKIQVEFNPARVQAYRLIGYDNRRLVDRDFNDDTKDAGEIGAGHTVTALYEVVPVGVPFEHALDAPAYRVPAEGPGGSSLMTVKLRYKQPSASVSQLLTHPVADVPVEVADASTDMMHASSVAIFGSLLSKRPLGAAATAPLLRSLSGRGVGADRFGHRAEFGSLIGEAQRLHCF